MVTKDEKRVIVCSGDVRDLFYNHEEELNTRTRASRTKTWSNQHGHSASTQVTKSIFFNILTSKQKLPARKRDFTMNIPEVQKSQAN